MNIKIVAVAGGCLVVGFGGGYFVRGVVEERKWRKLDAQMKHDQVIEEGEKTAQNGSEGLSGASEEVVVQDAEDDFKKVVDIAQKYVSNSENPLADSLHPTDDEGEFDDPFLIDKNREVWDTARNDEGDIYEILFEDYIEPGRYRKEHLTWYEDDETLCYENEEIVEDIYDLIGDSLEHFDDDPDEMDDADTLYIRNERDATDYEVTRLRAAYADVVLGDGSATSDLISDEEDEGD